MKQVDFYLISNRLRDAKYKLASRLANKLKRLDQKALLVTNSAQESETLSTIMWSLRDTSFLAHERIDQIKSAAQLQADYESGLNFAVIGDALGMKASLLDTKFDVMINLSREVPLFSHHFTRIAEIVESDDDSKAEARARYKLYQGEGFKLATHTLEL